MKILFSLALLLFVVFYKAPGRAVESSDPVETEPTFIVTPVNSHYPMDLLRASSEYKIVSARQDRPWYIEMQGRTRRVFDVARMNDQYEKWDELDRDLFLDRVERLGAKVALEKYPKLKLQQLISAEKEIRIIKASRQPAGDSK